MPDFALAKAHNIKISGLAACVPSHIVSNREAACELYGDDIDGVIKTTGVAERRTSPEGKITSLDLCIRAAEYLRDECGVSYDDFGGAICVTQTPDCLLPNNSTYAQQRLKLPLSVSAFDINLACSGYIYGLWAAALTAQSLSKAGSVIRRGYSQPLCFHERQSYGRSLRRRRDRDDHRAMRKEYRMDVRL